MFKAGSRRYHSGHSQYKVVVAAMNKSGVFKNRSIYRDIIRSKSTMSRNHKFVYIHLTRGQAAILNQNEWNKIDLGNDKKSEGNEEPEN